MNNIENDTTIKIKKDIYKKYLLFQICLLIIILKKLLTYILIQILLQMELLKLMQILIILMMRLINLVIYINFITTIKNLVRLNHNIISNVVNDKFDIQGINSTKINLLIHLVNNNKINKSVDLLDHNTVQVIYNDNIDTLKSDRNKSNISSNLEIINTNKSNITSNLEIINTNKSDISSNLEIINTNKNDIASNLGKINDNKEDILSLKIVILNLLII